VTIKVKGPGMASVTLDGAAIAAAALGLPRPADPGQHVIRAQAEGYATAETKVTLIEGGSATAELELKPIESGVAVVPAGPKLAERSPNLPGAQPPLAPQSTWSTRRTVGVVAAGAGVVGIVVGGVAGALASSKFNDSKAQCEPSNPNFCNAQGISLRNDTITLATVSTGAMIAGGVLAAGGAVLWFWPRSTQGAQTGSLDLVPAAADADIGLGLRGRW
jgi:hypothetical protein